MSKKANLLFLILGGFFIANVIIAEIIGSKIFSVEGSLGISPFQLNFFGEATSFNMTAGVLLWPFVFVLTDLINEYFGVKGVRTLSLLASVLIIYAFVMIYGAMQLQPADFWHYTEATSREGVVHPAFDQDLGFNLVMGQGMLIIIGSLTAFLAGQFVDVFTFHRLRRLTGSRRVWVRATGSTLISQLVDSFVVLGIAFYLPGKWSTSLFLAIALTNYLYKFVVAVAMTPVLLAVHALIDRWLGKEEAERLMQTAAEESRLGAAIGSRD